MEIKQKEIDISRREIEAKLAMVGDYVKMDFLQACLKKQLDFDTRKFVLTKLAGIYEARKMFLEAGKLQRASADINTTFEGKMNDFLRSTQLYIKGGNYEEADISYAKALATGNDKQKAMMKQKIKAAYQEQAKEFIARDKRKHAMEAYEKILTLDLDSSERKAVQQELLHLYNKLGKVREFLNLQKSITSGSAPPAPSSSSKPSFMRKSAVDELEELGL